MRSLVTACMNREHHLRRSLPHWLSLPGLDEIIIVDWSTREPLDDLLALDDRIRLLRVEGEPRWVLTYPYNLGIREARGDIILKCDADCLPSATVAQLVPAPGHFYAGDWRTGTAVGKTCVNGQCVFTKSQWTEVNGYSELLRRYGHDDGDFYDRLAAAGHARREIFPPELDFVAHDDAARLANHAPVKPDTIDAFLARHLQFHEAINIVVTGFMPWGRWYPQASYSITSDTGRKSVRRRDTAREIPLAPALESLAANHALRVVTGKVCQIPAAALARLDNHSCRQHLARRLQLASAA